MAGCTVINDTGMIKHRVNKGTRHVTETAIFSRRDVADILPGHRARCIITMTFCTVANDAGMIKGSVSEIHGVMANTAVLSRGRMGWRLFSRSNANKIAIVARSTIVGDTRMGKICGRHE